MNFETGLDQGKKSIKSINKAKARENLEKIMYDILQGDITDRTGYLFSEVMTFFDPPIQKKSDLGFVCSALGKKTDLRWYAQFAVVLPGIGLCATDSKRLHILKNFENEKPIYNPITKKWLTEKEADRVLSTDYPAVKEAVMDRKPKNEISEDDLQADGEFVVIKKGESRSQYPKKHIYDVIDGFKDPVFYWEPGKTPLWIEDNSRLAVIMPMY
jgi:hypothetical protein